MNCIVIKKYFCAYTQVINSHQQHKYVFDLFQIVAELVILAAQGSSSWRGRVYQGHVLVTD